MGVTFATSVVESYERIDATVSLKGIAASILRRGLNSGKSARA